MYKIYTKSSKYILDRREYWTNKQPKNQGPWPCDALQPAVPWVFEFLVPHGTIEVGIASLYTRGLDRTPRNSPIDHPLKRPIGGALLFGGSGARSRWNGRRRAFLVPSSSREAARHHRRSDRCPSRRSSSRRGFIVAYSSPGQDSATPSSSARSSPPIPM
jgi:hypothetical protein